MVEMAGLDASGALVYYSDRLQGCIQGHQVITLAFTSVMRAATDGTRKLGGVRVAGRRGFKRDIPTMHGASLVVLLSSVLR